MSRRKVAVEYLSEHKNYWVSTAQYAQYDADGKLIKLDWQFGPTAHPTHLLAMMYYQSEIEGCWQEMRPGFCGRIKDGRGFGEGWTHILIRTIRFCAVEDESDLTFVK